MDATDNIQQRRILIIDSTPEGDEDIVRLLEQQNNIVQVLTYQADVIAAIRTDPPDIILLNQSQTEGTGLDLCRQLKADTHKCDLPILFIIPATELDSRADLFAAGGSDYITRPFQPAEVVARVHTYSTLRHLQADQQQFRVFFEHAPVGIGISQNGMTTAVNTAYVQMFGYDQSDTLIGTPITDCIAPDDRPDVIARVQRRMRGEPAETRYPLTCLRKDGTLFPAICNVSRVNLRGRPTSVAFFVDITERKQAEDALRISEMRYRTIMQNFPNGSFYLFDHDLRYLLTQGAGMALVGLTPDMLEGKTIWESLDAEICATLEPAYRAALAGETTMLEVAYRQHIFEIYTLPVLDDQGVIIAGVAVTRVITEYRTLEASLRDSQARLQAILNNAAAGIIVLDEQGHFLEVNDRWLSMTGYTSTELLQLTPWDISPDEDNMYGWEHFQRLIRGDIDQYRLEKRYIRRDGSLFWGEISVTIIRNDQNQIDLVLAVAIDISDRKQAEQEIRWLNAQLEQRVLERTEQLSQANQALQAEISEHQRTEQALRESQHFIQNIADTIPDLLYVYDLDAQRTLYINHPTEQMPASMPAHMHPGDDHAHFSLLHPDDREQATIHQLQRIASARDGDILGLEYRVKFPDGTWRWLSVRETVFMRTHNNQPQQVLGVAQDITERKWSEEAYRTLVEYSPQGLVIIQDGQIVFANPAMTIIHGYTFQDMQAWAPDRFFDWVYAEDRPIVRSYMQHEHLDQQIALRYEYRIVRKDGAIRWVETHGVTTQYRGKPAYQGTYLDITERKHAEQQLRRYADELQQSITETRQFVYIVSHDLRAPLVNLKGFAAELATAMDSIRPIFAQAIECIAVTQRKEVMAIIDTDIAESLMFITSAVTQMDHLINALLKLSRMGQRELDLQPVDMQDLVTATLQTLAHQINTHRVSVTVDDLPVIIADQVAMEQIMGNILSNAISYTDPARPGQIDIRSEQNKDDIYIYIRDNGRGIAADDLEKIFAPFRRVGKNNIPGEGMGLTYVQALVRRHGGQIRCTSTLGVGTTFIIRLPIRADHLQQDDSVLCER